MNKINKKDNILIRKKLISELKKSGIKRISPESILLLETYFKETLVKLADLLKEEMIIKGRKTLKKEDVRSALKKIKKEEEFFEI